MHDLGKKGQKHVKMGKNATICQVFPYTDNDG